MNTLQVMLDNLSLELEIARNKLAAAEVRIAKMERVAEAGDALASAVDTIVEVEFREDGARSGYEDDVTDSLSAYRAAREASKVPLQPRSPRWGEP